MCLIQILAEEINNSSGNPSMLFTYASFLFSMLEVEWRREYIPHLIWGDIHGI